MSIAAHFEKMMELERQQREGPPMHGRRGGGSRGSDRSGWDDGTDDGDGGDRWEPAPAPAAMAGYDPLDVDSAADEELLLRFYADIEPEYATPAKVKRIVSVFQKKAAKTGADWREWMYSDMASKRGIDPREYVASAGGEQGGGGGGGGGDGDGDGGRDMSGDVVPRQAPVVAARVDPRLVLLGRRTGGGGRPRADGGGGGSALAPLGPSQTAPAAADWDRQVRLQKLSKGAGPTGGPGKYQ